MLAVCLRYCKNKEEAEDVLQEGFLRAFKYLDRYRNEGAFEGWLRKIMVNCALRKYGQLAKQQPVLGLEGFEDTNASMPEVYSDMGSRALLALVQQLPPACRMVFNLYVFEGLKHREIADMLGISEGTSKSNLSDARTLLKQQLENPHSPQKNKPTYG